MSTPGTGREGGSRAALAADAGAGSTVIRFPGRTARRRRLVRWGAAGLAALLSGALAWLLLASPVLAVDRVEVTGTHLVDRAAVEQRLQPLHGVPLPRIGTGRVAELVADVPGIESVRSTARPPTGIEVQVHELAPVAQWRGEGGLDLLLADGSILTGVSRDLLGEAPLPRASDALREAEPRVRAGAAAVLSSLPGAVREQVVGVSAATPEQVRLALADKTTIVWGDASRTDLKAGVAEAFLRRGDSAPPLGPKREIDVSVPERPITR